MKFLQKEQKIKHLKIRQTRFAIYLLVTFSVSFFVIIATFITRSNTEKRLKKVISNRREASGKLVQAMWLECYGPCNFIKMFGHALLRKYMYVSSRISAATVVIQAISI